MCVALTHCEKSGTKRRTKKSRRRLEEEEEKERGFDSLGGLSFRRRVSFYIECNKALGIGIGNFY